MSFHQSLYTIEGDSWIVWYPNDHYIEDINAVNEELSQHGMELVDILIKKDNSFN
jgi:hypothetical protein